MPFNRIKRPVAGTVLVAFLALVLQPLSVLAQDRPPSAASRRAAESGEEKFSRTLNEIHEILKELAPQAAMPHMFPRKKGETELRAIGPNMKIEVEPAKPAAGVDVAAKVSQLRAKAKELASLEEHVRAGFDETAQHIKDKNLPAEILARHEEALKAYEARAAEFKALVGAVDRSAAAGGAPLQTALNDLAAFMAKYPNQKTHTPSDPNNLPWGSPKPVTREPYTTPSQFRTSRLFGEPVRVAQAGGLSGISLPSTTLPATPVPADTAPTEDAQITQPIRDLAASLGNNPVQIYNWVRNNIEFIPSYGSIQGSDMTLRTKRGNAFDTASLLIALLRAANIPARYVYGTVQLPAADAMNWVGGVTVPQAAINLMAKGGIPVVGVAQSGQISAVRFEHVWVEAYVDYVPSRGAVNRNPNTWVPMDASFKQYTYARSIDLAAQVPLDVPAVLNQAKIGATVNDTEGWVQNVNQASVESALTAYQTQVKGHIDTQIPNASVGDVLGRQAIVAQNHSILTGTLPYRTLATGAKMAALPASLKWQYRTTLTDAYGITELASINQSTATLAGKKITMSFAPAGQADIDLVNSVLPKPHADGTPIQPSEIPNSLPGYLLHLKAEFRVDGQVVSSLGTVTMGETLAQTTALFNPSSQNWEEGESNQPTAGEYHAIALNLQGTTVEQLTALKTKLNATKAKLEQFQQNPNDPTPIQGLTKEDFSGDVLYSAILTYFASVDGADELAARASGNIVIYRLPSYGAFMAVAQPRFFFGIVRTVSFPGMSMDVDRVVYQVQAKDQDRAKELAYLRHVGAAGSAFEHAVPERLLIDTSMCNAAGTPTPDPAKPACTDGVSAVKALAIAAAQGQRIYTLDQTNQAFHATILSQLTIHADVKAEIANALAAGMEVRTHSADITVSGWTGSGYIILDPSTGAGAYKISGGANGSYVNGGLFKLLSLAALLATFLFTPLGPLFITFFLLSFILSLAALITSCIADTGSIGPYSILLATFLAIVPIGALRFSSDRALLDLLDKMFILLGWRLGSTNIGALGTGLLGCG